MTLNRRDFLSTAAILPALYLPFLTRGNPRPDPPPPPVDKIGLGVGIPWQLGEMDETFYDRALATLRPPWWYNWKFDQIGRPGYIPMYWRPEKGKVWEKAVDAANTHPEQEWLILNEPERGASLADPVEQAAILQDWIKETHTNFSIAGLLTSIDGVGWLERYLDAGGPMPTSWHFHIYGFENAEEWWNSLTGPTFAEWYERFGSGLPVTITETNANTASNDDEQIVLMFAINELLVRAPFVRGVGWYAAYDVFEVWPWANLIDKEGNATSLGRFYSAAFGVDQET